LLGITTGLRGILDEGWLERPPLPMPLANPASAREGDDLRPGKPAISSSFIELPSVAGEEGLEGAAFSKTPRTEVEPGRVGEAADKSCNV
jgi:hypothetical protein